MILHHTIKNYYSRIQSGCDMRKTRIHDAGRKYFKRKCNYPGMFCFKAVYDLNSHYMITPFGLTLKKNSSFSLVMILEPRK